MSKSKSSSATTPAQVWGEQTPYLAGLYSKGQDLYNSQNPQNANQILGQQQALDYAGSQQLNNIIGGAQSAYQQTLNPSSSPYSQGVRDLGMAGFGGVQSAMNTQGGSQLQNVDTSGFGRDGATQIQGIDFNSLNASGGTQLRGLDYGSLKASGDTQIQGTDFAGFGANNPYLDSAVQNAMGGITRNFKENILSGITDNAVAAGQTGSSRQGVAEGIAAREANRQASETASNMYSNAYAQDMSRGLQARGMESQLNQAQGSLSEQGRQFNQGQNLQVGQLEQQLNQSQGQLSEQGRQFNQGQGLQVGQLEQQYNQAQGSLSEQGRQFNLGQGFNAAQLQAQQNQAQSGLLEQQRQYNIGTSLDASRYGAGMYSDAYGTNLTAQQNAINQAGTMANLGMTPSSIYSQTGSQQQAAPWQQLQNYQNLLGSPTVLGGASSSSSKGGTASALGGIF